MSLPFRSDVCQQGYWKVLQGVRYQQATGNLNHLSAEQIYKVARFKIFWKDHSGFSPDLRTGRRLSLLAENACHQPRDYNNCHITFASSREGTKMFGLFAFHDEGDVLGLFEQRWILPAKVERPGDQIQLDAAVFGSLKQFAHQLHGGRLGIQFVKCLAAQIIIYWRAVVGVDHA